MTEILLQSAAKAFSPSTLFACLLGTVGGITIGALPGLTATMGVGLLIPFTFGMDPVSALVMLAAIYCSAIYGGSISAILINTPGTPSAAATTFDGYPLAQKGQGGKAIAVATVGSFCGGILSAFALILIAPVLARIALQFGPPEYFALAVFGLSIICTLTTKNMLKGLIAGVVGLLIGCIGMDPVTGVERFTFGRVELLWGISFIPALIGLFSFSQALVLAENCFKSSGGLRETITGTVAVTWQEFKDMLATILRSSGIGTVIGAIPGAGGEIAAFIAYNEAKRFSKRREEFGTGVLEGVVAAETANNAVTGGALIPLLTLGIPGDAVTAIMLGGLLIQGLQPGPELFTKNAHIVYPFLIGLIIANVLLLVIGLAGARMFAKVLDMPDRVLIPVIIGLSIVGSYAINQSMFDVALMLILGFLGYLMRKTDFDASPVVLGIILGPMAERNLRRTMLMYGGSAAPLLKRPIAVGLIVVSVISVVSAYIIARPRKKASTQG